MNIDEMTIGQARELSAMFGQNDSPRTGILSGYVGKYAIIRSRNEGINAGTIKAIDSSGVILSDARRIWYHKPADKKLSWYEGVATSGLSSDSKVSGVVPEKAIIEDYSITLCTSTARQSIESAVPNAQP